MEAVRRMLVQPGRNKSLSFGSGKGIKAGRQGAQHAQHPGRLRGRLQASAALLVGAATNGRRERPASARHRALFFLLARTGEQMHSTAVCVAASSSVEGAESVWHLSLIHI